MELEEFVSETIQQIVAGVATAKEAVARQRNSGEHKAEVNPEKIALLTKGGMQEPPMIDAATNRLLDKLHFDVAVTVTEGSTEKGGIGIFVGPVGVGAQAQAETANQSVSRIQFAVPIFYP